MAEPDEYEVCVDWNSDGDFGDANEDITADIKALNWQRGKDKQLGSTQAAILNLVIKPGSATKYSPENAGGVLYGNLLPYKVVRVRVKIGVTWYTQFYGYIKKIIPHPHWGKNDAYIYCVDGMEQLARAIGSMDYNLLFPATSSDGVVWNTANGYAVCHNAANGDFRSQVSKTLLAENALLTAPTYLIIRAFLFFDTSIIPDDATLTKAVLRLYLTSKIEENSGQSTLHVVEGVQDDPLQLNDFGDHLSKTTSGGSIAYSVLPDVNNHFDISLNDTGKGWVNKTGITKLCLRVSGDIDNTVPTNAGAGKNYIMWSSSEKGVESQRPKLIVYYNRP